MMKPLEEVDLTEEESVEKIHPASSLTWNLKARKVHTIQNKRIKSILSHVAYTIGLGSLWRFPYLCHLNGGGGFILTYHFLLLFMGVPLLYLEMMVSQWLCVDNICVWGQFVPWLGGISYASTLVCVLMGLYNSVIVSWSLFYLGQAFQYPLPWGQCPLVKNVSMVDCLRTLPHQYFWYNTTLQASGRMEEGIETLVLSHSLCLFATWVFLCLTVLTGGMKIPTPMLIFSIFVPNILFVCFLVRGLFLEGAGASLRRMVTTELSTLSSLDLWRQAGGHVLYSLGLGKGTITTSYKATGDSPVKAASFLVLANVVTSMLTTSIIFLMLGFWATTSGPTCTKKSVSSLIKLISKGVLPQEAKPPENILLRPPEDYLDWIIHLPKHLQNKVIHLSLTCSILVQTENFVEGPGLAFMAFSQAVLLLPRAYFWAIIFFLTLVIMELGTMMQILEGVVLPLQSSISVFTKHPRLVPGIVCLGGLLGSLVFTSHAGSYVLSLFDDHVVPLTLLIIVTFQNVALAWIYGARRFQEEVFGKLGHLVLPTFSFLWSYVTPPGLLGLLGICLARLYHRGVPHYTAWNSSTSQEVKLPYQRTALGWVAFLSSFALLPIPLYPLHRWWHMEEPAISNTPGNPESFKNTSMLSPSPLQRPTYPTRKSRMGAQSRGKENSPRELSTSLARALASDWRNVRPTLKASSWSSWSTIFPWKSSNVLSSAQMSLVSLSLDNDRHVEAVEGHPPGDSAPEAADPPDPPPSPPSVAAHLPDPPSRGRGGSAPQEREKHMM